MKPEDFIEAQGFALQIVEIAAEDGVNYNVAFNGYSMAVVASLIPYMEDNNIEVNQTNMQKQLEKFVSNLYSAGQFYVNQYLDKKEQLNGTEPVRVEVAG